MRIVSKKALRDFWQRHPDAEGALRSWYREVKRENWDGPADVMRKYPRASIVGGNRAVFRIRGGSYRLVVHVNYPKHTVYVRFVGTHSEYDAIAVEEV